MRRLIGLLLVLPLCGCASVSRAERNSPDFKAGYSDGCASADRQGADPREDGLRRDEAAYQGNKPYHDGWGIGFSACRPYRPLAGDASRPDRSPIPDPTPGGLPH